MSDIGNLFGEDDDEYYKPIKTKSAFNSNYKKIKIYLYLLILSRTRFRMNLYSTVA